jgi:hypothetical protein
MKLSDSQRKTILQRIEKLFETTKARLLGRYFKGPHIIFEVLGQSDPLDSIEGLYTWALAMMYGAGIRPDQKTIENLAEITGNYFDSQKLKVKNHILNAILAAKDHKEAMASVKDHFDKASKYVEMLTGNETRSVIAYANREGIARVASDIGVSDPTIVFRGVVDDKICKYCKQMYHDPNNIRKPRPYKLSQLAHGYFKPKLWDGKTPFDGAHPNCRHTMTMVAPGFTFNEQGISDFKSFTHDYYSEYYSVHKSEEPTGERLIKAEQFMDYDEYLEWSQNLENPHQCHEGCNH